MRPFEDTPLKEIEAVYRLRFSHFVQVATAIVGDQELALEAVQDAFAGVVRDRSGFRGEGPLEAWIWRAVVNAAYNVRRQDVATDQHVAAAEARGNNGYEPREGSQVGAQIALLPERQRLALFLRYYADLDYRSIAAALGVEVGTVSATLSSAHASLRRALGKVER
jgi:RNA polymerase sigma-70 factor (ECF subfamily)